MSVKKSRHLPNKKQNKSITMMRGKSPPHEHKNIHISNNIENCNQLSVSLKVYSSGNPPGGNFQTLIISTRSPSLRVLFVWKWSFQADRVESFGGFSVFLATLNWHKKISQFQVHISAVWRCIFEIQTPVPDALTLSERDLTSRGRQFSYFGANLGGFYIWGFFGVFSPLPAWQPS